MARQQQQQKQAARQPQPLHPLATLVAVVFDFFLRGVLDLTRPPRELVGLFVRGVFTSLCWAYHALPMPVAMGMFYYGFQSVPDGLRSVEELRVVHSSRPDAGAMAGGASGIDGLYGLGELAVVRWGDLGLVSVSCFMTSFSSSLFRPFCLGSGMRFHLFKMRYASGAKTKVLNKIKPKGKIVETN